MADSSARKLYVKTPLVESVPISKRTGLEVFMKFENVQPTSSFKIRGIGNLILKAKEKGYRKFVASSGGNAGLAAAYAARNCNVSMTIYVPSSTPEFFRKRLELENATVVVHGKVWDEANARAMKDAENPEVFNVHPFDHPDIWEGHASMIEELHEDMSPGKPDLIITSVGGGGLSLGILKGLRQCGWSDVPLLCMETIGADSFNASVKAGKLVTLLDITSIAKCLGALTVAKELFTQYEQSKDTILSETITDKECLQAVLDFLEDHKMLVEPACAASLAALYSGTIKRLQAEKKLSQEVKRVVLIVCGGLGVNMEYVEKWKKEVGLV